eukprot:s3162_g5.t1
MRCPAPAEVAASPTSTLPSSAKVTCEGSRRCPGSGPGIISTPCGATMPTQEKVVPKSIQGFAAENTAPALVS